MAPKTSKTPDIVTLADLAPRRTVVGGSERRVFGATAHPDGERTMASKKTAKDLPAGKTVKGGKIATNDSLTLVRAARRGMKA